MYDKKSIEMKKFPVSEKAMAQNNETVISAIVRRVYS